MTDGYLKKHFPYLKRNTEGDFIIPAIHVEAFVRTYMGLLDDAEHLEKLALYRNRGQRAELSEIDD